MGELAAGVAWFGFVLNVVGLWLTVWYGRQSNKHLVALRTQHKSDR